MNHRVPELLKHTLEDIIWRRKLSKSKRGTKKKEIIARVIATAPERDLINDVYPTRPGPLVQLGCDVKEELARKITRISVERKKLNRRAGNRALQDSEEAVFSEMLARRLYIKRIKYRLISKAVRKSPAELTAQDKKIIAHDLEQLYQRTGYHPTLRPLNGGSDVTDAEKAALAEYPARDLGSKPPEEAEPQPKPKGSKTPR